MSLSFSSFFMHLLEGGNRLEFLWTKYGETEVKRRTAAIDAKYPPRGVVDDHLNGPEVPASDPRSDTYRSIMLDVRTKFNQCLAADPTSKIMGAEEGPWHPNAKVVAAGGYSEWILRCWLATSNSSISGIARLEHLFFEDLYKVREDLDIFRRIQQRLPIEDRNLFKLKSPQQLFELINRFAVQNKIGKTKMQNMQDVEVIYDDNTLFVGIPKTYEASRMLGADTRWCTAASSGSSYFNQYTAEGPLIVVIEHSRGMEHPTLPPDHPEQREVAQEEKWQLHFESGQFMNAEDHAVTLEAIFTQLPKLKGILRAYFLKSVEAGGKGLGQVAEMTDYENPEELASVAKLCTPERVEEIAENSPLILNLVMKNAIPFEIAKKGFEAANSGSEPAFLESPTHLRVCFSSLQDPDLLGLFHDSNRDSCKNYATSIFQRYDGDGDYFDFDADLGSCLDYYMDKEMTARVTAVVHKLIPETEREEEGDPGIEYWIKSDERCEELRQLILNAGSDALQAGYENEGWKAVMGALDDLGLHDMKWINVPGQKGDYPGFLFPIKDAIEVAKAYRTENGHEHEPFAQMIHSYSENEGEKATFDTRRLDFASADDEAFNERLSEELGSMESDLGIEEPEPVAPPAVTAKASVESFLRHL